MDGQGFVPALLRGLIVAGGIALASFLSMMSIGFLDEETAFMFLFASALGAVAFLVVGGALVGAVLGITAGRGTGSLGAGAGAGAILGVGGYILFAVALFAGLGVAAAMATDADGSAGLGMDPTEDSPLEWSAFGKALMFAVPAGIAGAAAGAAGGLSAAGPPRPGPAAPGTAAAFAPRQAITRDLPSEEAEPTGPRPAEGRTVSCPKCGASVTVVRGKRPVCTACGYGG